jgi:hypothetical protein
MWGRSTSPSNSTEFPISPRYAGIPSRLRESQPSLRIDEKADVAQLVEQRFVTHSALRMLLWSMEGSGWLFGVSGYP